MNTFAKKLLAGAAIVSSAASVAYFGFVHAQSAGQGFEGAEVVNVTNTGFTVTGAQLSGNDYDFSTTGLDYVRVYSGSTKQFDSANTASIVNKGIGTFTFSGINMSNLNSGNYRVSFGTTDGDGAAVLSKGGADQVTVNARVEPILRMSLSTGALDFGTLQTSTTNKVTMSGEVATNAVDGLSVTAESANGGLYSNSANFTINTNASGAVDYTFSSTGSNSSNSDLIIDQTALNTNGVNSIVDSTPFNVYSTSHPESFNGTDDFQLDIRADIDETTPAASDYTDTVTYTVTANF